jgi:hypothetical protein
MEFDFQRAAYLLVWAPDHFSMRAPTSRIEVKT